MTDIEFMVKITGLPREKIIGLMEECGMPIDVDGLSLWLEEEENSARLFQEQVQHFNEIMHVQ